MCQKARVSVLHKKWCVCVRVFHKKMQCVWKSLHKSAFCSSVFKLSFVCAKSKEKKYKRAGGSERVREGRSFPKTLILHSRCGETLGNRRETSIATFFSPLIIFYPILVVIDIVKAKPFALKIKKFSTKIFQSCFFG